MDTIGNTIAQPERDSSILVRYDDYAGATGRRSIEAPARAAPFQTGGANGSWQTRISMRTLTAAISRQSCWAAQAAERDRGRR